MFECLPRLCKDYGLRECHVERSSFARPASNFAQRVLSVPISVTSKAEYLDALRQNDPLQFTHNQISRGQGFRTSSEQRSLSSCVSGEVLVCQLRRNLLNGWKVSKKREAKPVTKSTVAVPCFRSILFWNVKGNSGRWKDFETKGESSICYISFL